VKERERERERENLVIDSLIYLEPGERFKNRINVIIIIIIQIVK